MGAGRDQDPPVGTPANSSGVGTPQQGQGGVQGSGNATSREEIIQIIRDTVGPMLQGIKDKRFAKLETAIEELRQAGVPQQAIDEALRSQQQPGSQPVPSQPAAAAQQQGGGEGQQFDDLPPIVQSALEMMAEAEVWIEDGDPELAGIDMSNATKNRRQFLGQVEDAIEKKRARLADTATARAPAIGGGGSGSAGGGKDALTQELKRLLEHPTQNIVRIREVKAELSKYR